MKQSFSFVWCIMALSITAFACDEHSDSSGEPGCVPGCYQDIQVTCGEDGSEIKEVCINGCDGSVCKGASDKKTCVPGCQNDTAITCNADGMTIKESCEGRGCDGDVCKTSSSCTPGCRDGVATSCGVDGKPVTTSCGDLGCDGDVCKTSSSCTPGCRDGVATSCGADGKPVTTSCDLGCDGSGCMQPEPFKPCQGVVCANGGTCEHGVCLTEQMKTDFDEGYFISYCSGQLAVDMEGYVEDCSDNGGCSMTRQDGWLIATCRGERAEACVREGQVVKVCGNDDGIVGTTSYECRLDIEGQYYLYPVKTDFCLTDRCNEDETACDESRRCDGNAVLTFDGDKLISAESCNTCVVIDGEAACRTQCVSTDYPSPQVKCQFDEELEITECAVDDNERFYLATTKQHCDGGCSDLVCHEESEVVPEAERCHETTFVPHCDGDMVVFCSGGVIRSYSCRDELSPSIPGMTTSEDPLYCARVQGKLGCFQKCETQGKTAACDDGSYDYDGASLSIECLASDDPEDPSFYASVDVTYCGEDGCDANTLFCVDPIIPEAYQACNGTFKPYCDGSIAVNCDVDMRQVMAEACDPDALCEVIDGYAQCFSSCPQATPEYYTCDPLSNGEIVHTCFERAGKWYQGKSRYQACPDTCDRTTGRCVRQYDDEGDYCVPSEMKGRCEGNDLVSCQGYRVVVDHCEDFGRVCVKFSDHASCDEP